jgi:hypothetical protein
MVKKTPKYKPITELSEGSLAKFIVSKYVPEKKNIMWARDIPLAKRLLKIAPDPKFWEVIEPISLIAFPQLFTEKSLAFLKNKYRLFKFEIDKTPKQEYNLQAVKVGEDLALENKPKTLMDFLNKD